MSTLTHVIEERARDIGGFTVGRLLPFRRKRMVGPFIFLDHMGPKALPPGEGVDVPPHPHIGLATLTYLLAGTIRHRDSLGTDQAIMPGAVNWMTAGRGIVHAERTPAAERERDGALHGLQIWVALPKALQQMPPAFAHVAAADVPQWQADGVQYKLLAGEALGHRSPGPVYSPLYLLELQSEQGAGLDLLNELPGESALYILAGGVRAEGQHFGPQQLLVAQDATRCSFTLAPGSRVFLFGGEPFEEPRHIYWNFVSTEQALIDRAKADWRAKRFPAIPGESAFVPLPE